jgi:metallo-beta-lactamase class B
MPSIASPSLNLLAFIVTAAAVLHGQTPVTKCDQCEAWNKAQKPFKLYGNSYFVGTHGLSAILIASDEGHVLLDGALAESAAQIAANIRSLGFRVEDIKLIGNSHVHFDHAAGIAELQRISAARVAALPWSAAILKSGGAARDDPQYGTLPAIAPIANVEVVKDGETLHIGDIDITPHLTAGHTPGGTSWTWISCEGRRCVSMVYADSLTAVSAPNFKFSASPDYPNAVRDFRKSFEFLRETSCEILVTPHPDVSDLWQRLDAGKFIDPTACKQLADHAEQQLGRRLLSEEAK